MAGTAGGDFVLANLAGAVQAVVEEDRLLLPAAAAAAAGEGVGGAAMTPSRARQAPVVVEEEEVEVAAAAGPGEKKKKKKKKHFLRGLFRRKKHEHKLNHRPTAEDLVQVMGGATTTASSTTNASAGGGNGSRSPPHHHGPGGAAACPQHGQRPKSPVKVASPQCQQQQQVRQLGTPATGRGEEGKVLSWTLPAVAATYFVVRLTVAPLVRSFSGPVGEAIVLAVLLQQVLSLLLKKDVLDAASLPSLGGVDVSHAFFAASLVLALGSVVLTALRADTIDLKHIEAPGIWERLSLSSNNETVHLVNTGLFLLVLAMIACQPKTRKEIRRLSSARVTSTKAK